MVPGQKLAGNISFLVDTGADVTTIMPDDSKKLGIDLSLMSGAETATGIGGSVDTTTDPSLLTFFEQNTDKLRLYSMPLDFISPNSHTAGMPSLLGRDVLDRWRMNYDPARGKLTFTVRSADLTA